jgi:hypothetical protein
MKNTHNSGFLLLQYDFGAASSIFTSSIAEEGISHF